MDNSDWRKQQKSLWPTGSLERSLLRNYPGCRTASEALKKTLVSRQEPAKPVQLTNEPSELEKYLALRESIKSVEHYVHNGFDTWLVPEHIRERLNEMPINSIEEALLWRDCWKKEIKKIKG